MEDSGRTMTDGRTPAERPPSVSRPRNNRAAVTNGRLLPRGIDGRSAEGRRWKDLFAAYRGEMPPGAPTVAQDARLRALTTVTLRLERIAADSVRGAPVDDAQLVALSNLQGRLLEALGIVSRPSEHGDPLARYREITGIDVR